MTSGEKKLVSGYRYKIVDTSTDFSMTKTLNIKNLTLGDKGRYVCKGQRLKTPMTSAAVISNSRRSSSNQFALEPSERSFQVRIFQLCTKICSSIYYSIFCDLFFGESS